MSPSISSGIYLRLILTMIFWGGTFVAGRIASEEMHPYAAATGRFLIASVALLLFIYMKEKKFPRLNGRQWVAMVLLGLTGVFSYNMLFFIGLQHVEAGRGAMIIAANPVVTTILAILLLGERFNCIKSIGIFVAVAGTITVISRGDLSSILQGAIGKGELCLLGCVFSWAAYALIGRKMLVKIPPLVAVAYSCLTGVFFLLAAAIVNGSAAELLHPSTRGGISLLYLALFGTALGFCWFYEGVRALGAARASLFVNLVPVSGVLLGILVLGERPDRSLFVGGTLVLGGLFLINYNGRLLPARSIIHAKAYPGGPGHDT